MNNIKCVVLLFLLSHTLSVYAYVDIHSKKIKNTIIYRKEFLALQSDTSLSKTKISYVSQDEKKNKKKEHSRLYALLLSLPIAMLGIAGVHRFYLGYEKTGKIMVYTLGVLFSIALISQFFYINLITNVYFLSAIAVLAVWSVVDMIRIISGDLKFKDGTPTEW